MHARSGWVAGLNHGHHDAAAVLLKFGDLGIWVEQERISRRKHAVGESPADALATCLDHEGLRLSDLDAVGLGSDHDILSRWLGLSPAERAEKLPYDRPQWLFPERVFAGEKRPPVVPVRHHVAHAASAHLASGFSESAILVMDAMGENTSISIAHGVDHEIRILEEFGVEDSLGFFYEAASRHAGFTRHQAGKLMGLAAYGQPQYPMPIDARGVDKGHIWTLRDNAARPGRAGIEAREDELLDFFATECLAHAAECPEEVMLFKDFAASAQAALQDCVTALARRACRLSGVRRLTLAGGVALNCSANRWVAACDAVDELFVQPASTDSGVAFGAALLVSEEIYGARFKPEPMTHAYHGRASTRDEIMAALDAADLPRKELHEAALIERVAEIIAENGVVAWHQGRPEVGPRALGARSLLGNPGRRRNLLRMNTIKSREAWRPLAPSVLQEAFEEYFDGHPNPFMIVAAMVRPEARRKIPAVTHVDGSARPQIVNESTAPRYARLLRALKARTGIPVVINTSLNGPTDPICYSARDSVAFFQNTTVDALAIGDFLVERSVE